MPFSYLVYGSLGLVIIALLFYFFNDKKRK